MGEEKEKSATDVRIERSDKGGDGSITRRYGDGTSDGFGTFGRESERDG